MIIFQNLILTCVMNCSYRFKSVLLLLTLGFIWGAGYSLAKFAITNGAPPLGYSFWQSLGPALLLSVVYFFKQRKSLPILLHWRYFLLCGLLGIALPNTNMYYAASHVPAGLLAVLVNTVPLIVYPLALLFRMEPKDFGVF